MRILIADDHAILRAGLIEILADEFPEAKFGEAGSARQTLALLKERRWDVLLLDIFMPDQSGLEVLRELAAGPRQVPVLVLSSAPEEQLAARVLQAGAAGYLNKLAAPEELVLALKRVMSGGKYVSASLAETLVSALPARPGTQGAFGQLSSREFQVTLKILAGKSIKEIAAELSISPKTASTFRARVLEKLRVRNDVELVRYAIENGFLESTTPPAGKAPPKSL